MLLIRSKTSRRAHLLLLGFGRLSKKAVGQSPGRHSFVAVSLWSSEAAQSIAGDAHWCSRLIEAIGQEAGDCNEIKAPNRRIFTW